MPYIIVIGASTGGVDALKKIIKNLPADIQASIFIVWHMSPDVRGILPKILSPLNVFPVAHAVDRDTIKKGHIYIAPPDYHLLLEDGRVRVSRGPKENRFRPAIDPLFRSAAFVYGKNVIGVVLSGALDDGMAGMWRVKESGGTCVVQDPADAEVASMPASVMRTMQVDYCMPAAEIGHLLGDLCKNTVTGDNTTIRDGKTKKEIDIADEDNPLEKSALNFGELSPYTCPECHGVLFRITEGNYSRYRCHTGHAYSVQTLMESLNEKIEENLYNALRCVDETVILLNHVGDHFAEDNHPKMAAAYFQKAGIAVKQGDNIRETIFNLENLSNDKIMSEGKNGDDINK